MISISFTLVIHELKNPVSLLAVKIVKVWLVCVESDYKILCIFCNDRYIDTYIIIYMFSMDHATELVRSHQKCDPGCRLALTAGPINIPFKCWTWIDLTQSSLHHHSSTGAWLRWSSLGTILLPRAGNINTYVTSPFRRFGVRPWYPQTSPLLDCCRVDWCLVVTTALFRANVG